MPAISLNQAKQNLEKAVSEFTVAHDAAMSDDRISDRLMIEIALTNIESAKAHWRSNRGLTFVAAAERHLRFVLGMEDAS